VKTVKPKERVVALTELPAPDHARDNRSHHPHLEEIPPAEEASSLCFWLPVWLPLRDGLSKMVGRTGFEPVTSSVSGNSRAVPGVWRCRTESNGEPPSCDKNLTGSRWVRGRLIALAPVSGSPPVGTSAMSRWTEAVGASRYASSPGVTAASFATLWV
jgi:hypothetical protein